ncbi:transposase, partial [Roseomonas stagni]
GYAGFKALERSRNDGSVVLAFCWAHLRRRFFESHAGTASPIAAEALLRIGEIYAIEREIRGQSPPQRVAIRQASTAPLVAAMQTWLRAQLNRVSSDSALAKAIRYGLRHWTGLERFLT